MVSKTKAALQAYRDAGTRAAKLKSTEAIALTTGRKRIVLITAQGVTTAAGEYWKRIGGALPPAGGFASQTPMREGNTETIKMRNARAW